MHWQCGNGSVCKIQLCSYGSESGCGGGGGPPMVGILPKITPTIPVVGNGHPGWGGCGGRRSHKEGSSGGVANDDHF